MTKEQVVERAIKEYEELLSKKSKLEKEVAQTKEDIKAKASELAHAISDAGMKQGFYDGRTYTPGVYHKYYLIGAGAADEAGIDRFAPFENDPALEGLVHKDVNWRSMQRPLQEMEDAGLLSDDVRAVLNIVDEFGITRRKADTGNMEKVAAAIAKERGE